MARRGKQQLSRFALRVVALALVAVAVGVSSSASVQAETATAAEGVALLLTNAPPGDPSLLRPAVPLGYGTVAETAARQAARAAAGEAVATVAAAAAPPAAVEASAPAPEPAGAPPATPQPAPAGPPWPLDVDPGGATQLVTVVAPSWGATTAQLTAWQLGPAGWTAVLGPVPARIGAAGVGQASESTSRTPAGVFTLTEAFGRQGNPGTALPYRAIDPQDWWVSDVASPLYNRHARCAPGTCPFDERAGENLWAVGAAYDHAVVIDYNRGGTPGAGSAFFLHVSNGAPTAGCVAIDGGSLVALLRWLNPGAGPRIAIGVG